MINAKVSIKDDRKEWDGMINTVGKMKNPEGNAVDIGVFGENGSDEVIIAGAQEFGAKIDHPGGTSYGYRTEAEAKAGKVRFMATGEGYMQLGVTEAHEIKIPERPFIRKTFDDEKEGINQQVDKAKVDIVLGKVDKETFLKRLGLFFQKKVVEKIDSSKSWAEPNAPSTIRAKGSDHPLVDEGRLRQSITHRLVK